jgi:hypothetical protein
VTIGVANEIGDSSVDCQSYVAFVIEVVGALGLSIGPPLNEITSGRHDDTGSARTSIEGRGSPPILASKARNR